MSTFLDKVMQKEIDRRKFIKGGAAITAAAALGLSLGGHKNSLAEAASSQEGNAEGEWITAACWHNCGGRCLNKALVVDGVVVRQKTDDTHEDSPDYPQQRGCARGRAHRKMVLGADRLKYPMIRKNWEPGGGQKELRGRDEWVRLSWDEALDILASELERIKATYGNASIFAPVGGSDSLQAVPRFLSAYGGYTARWGNVSWGAWPSVYMNVTGLPNNGASSGNDRFRLRESKLIILWGANPVQSSQGLPGYNYLQAKKAGAKFIVIDPIYSETAQMLADEWIPVRPATDTALILGMAHYIITNNLLDKEFLDSCTIGFDASHMPEGADPKSNFQDYVLGTYDKTPKTPEWASQICGVNPEMICHLAHEYATTKPAAIISGGAPARINNGEQLPHAMLTLAYMAGNVGIPGAGVSPNMHNSATNAGAALVQQGGNGLPALSNPLSHKINSGEMWDAILKGSYTASKNNIVDINIQMIWNWFGHTLNQRAGTSTGIKAYKEVEFIVSQNLFLTTDARYSDLVLPIDSEWERPGGILTGNREILIYYNQVMEPLFEAKSDVWVATEIARRVGVDPQEVFPISEAQQLYNRLAGATVILPDGSAYEPLLTLTPEDISAIGAEGEPQTGRITYQQFKENGIYQVPRAAGDNLVFTSFEDFRADPESNPLNTPSGKFEIHCDSLASAIDEVGFTSKSPIPEYEPTREGYEEGIADGYPLQLVTIHYFRRSHSTLDNVPCLREAFPQEFRMNSDDANVLGIRTGDIVKITSRHGSVIRPALITETIRPGVVALGEGAWVEMDENDEIDKAGCTGILDGHIPTGQGHSGYNSCNVRVEKYNKPLTPDVEWPQRIIFGEV